MQRISPTPIRGMTYIPDDRSSTSRNKVALPSGPLVRRPSKSTHTNDLNASESFLHPRTPPLTRKPSLLVHEVTVHAPDSGQRDLSRTPGQIHRARSLSKGRSGVTSDHRRSDDQAHRHSARYYCPSSNLKDSIRHPSLTFQYSNDGSPEGTTSISPPRTNEYTSILDPGITHNTALHCSIDEATSSSPLVNRLEFNFSSVVEDPKPRPSHHSVNNLRIVDRPRGRSHRPQAKSQASGLHTFYAPPGVDYPPRTPPEGLGSASASPENRSPEEQTSASPISPTRTVPYARPTPTNSLYLAARPRVPTRRKSPVPYPRALHPTSAHTIYPPRPPTAPNFKALPYATYSTPPPPLPAQPRRVAVLQQPEALRSCWFESTEGSTDGEGESTSRKRAQFRKILHNRVSLGTLNMALGSVVGLVSKDNSTATTTGPDREKKAGAGAKAPRWSWIPATQPGSWPLPAAPAQRRSAVDGRSHSSVRNAPDARPAPARSMDPSLSRMRAKSSTALRTRENRSGSEGGGGGFESWILRLLCDG